MQRLRPRGAPDSADVAAVLLRLVHRQDSVTSMPHGESRPFDFFTAIGLVYATLTGSRTREMGAVYTPSWVARRLIALMGENGIAGDTVLDPACGGGALLLAWLDGGFGQALRGWDVDEHAVEICRAVLATYAKERGLKVDLDVRVRDLFDDDATVAHGEVVLMNPPYGTDLTELAQGYASQAELCGREPDLFVLALERILMSAEGVGVIVPDVIRMQPEYRRLRLSLTQSGRLRELEQLRFGTFPTVSVQPNLLVMGPSREGGVVRFRDQDGHQREVLFTDLMNDEEYRWRVRSQNLDVYWRRWPLRLGDIAYCHEGVHTGNIRSKLFTNDPSAGNARAMLKGADIRPFAYSFTGRYVRYDPGLVDRNAGEYASLRKPEIFKGPKLLSRQTTSQLIVCLDRGDYVTDNTIHTIRVRAGLDLPIEWLALYLNSSLATALYRHQSGEFGRPLPQIKLKFLRALPVPYVSEFSEALKLYHSVETTARSGPLTRAFSARVDRFVFDTAGVPESDRFGIQQFARLDSRRGYRETE